MKNKSIIRPYVQDYLRFRKRLGFSAHQDPFQLNVFERYLNEKNVTSFDQINSDFVMDLTQHHLKTKSPHTVTAHLIILNNFFLYLQRQSLVDSNPFTDRISIRENYFSPYVFSDQQMNLIMKSFAADVRRATDWRRFVQRIARYSIIFIQAHCGLRISEACNIKFHNVNLVNKTLFIEKTKFYKDRLLPISNRVLGVIKNYLSVRNHILGNEDSEFLFLSYSKKRYSRKTLGYFFNLKMIELGIYQKPYTKGNIVFGSPSTHSLRHSFAVRVVRRWHKQGLPIDKIADTLATYMGHAEFNYTQTYLKDLTRNPEPLIIYRNFHERADL